jgi:hypothetical protein
MVIVAQLVRALDCGSRGRGFESPLSPSKGEKLQIFFGVSIFSLSLQPLSAREGTKKKFIDRLEEQSTTKKSTRAER